MSHFPMAYLGNKRLDIKYFAKYFPDPETYSKILEPFAGSGAVSFYLSDKVDEIILNDRNDILIELYNKWVNGFDQLKEWSTIPEIEKLLHKMSGAGSFKRAYGIISKNTKKKEKFREALISKGTIMQGDWIDAINEHCDENTFVYLDPPYFDSNNKTYITSKTKINDNPIVDIEDGTKIFIDILNLLKESDCKIMLVINKNAITEFIYSDYIVGEYEKIYGMTIIVKGEKYKKRTKHIIITNY